MLPGNVKEVWCFLFDTDHNMSKNWNSEHVHTELQYLTYYTCIQCFAQDTTYLVCPAAGQQQHSYTFCCCFLFVFKNDVCQTNYLQIYMADLLQIFRVGRTVTVDDQYEISCSIPQGTLSWQPNFVSLLHVYFWMQAG